MESKEYSAKCYFNTDNTKLAYRADMLDALDYWYIKTLKDEEFKHLWSATFDPWALDNFKNLEKGKQYEAKLTLTVKKIGE